MQSVLFSQAARSELLGAQDWYEREAPGLGRRFRHEVDAVVQRLADDPQHFPVVFKNVRRARTRRFPYALFFVIQTDVLFVIACFHSSRNPTRWQRRT